MSKQENPYQNANGSDLYDYYLYLQELASTIAMEQFYIKQVLDERTIKNLNEEQVAKNILPEEYFKVRKKEITGKTK